MPKRLQLALVLFASAFTIVAAYFHILGMVWGSSFRSRIFLNQTMNEKRELVSIVANNDLLQSNQTKEPLPALPYENKNTVEAINLPIQI